MNHPCETAHDRPTRRRGERPVSPVSEPGTPRTTLGASRPGRHRLPCQTKPICAVFGPETGVGCKNKPNLARALPVETVRSREVRGTKREIRSEVEIRGIQTGQVRQTKPIFRVFGLETGVIEKAKPIWPGLAVDSHSIHSTTLGIMSQPQALARRWGSGITACRPDGRPGRYVAGVIRTAGDGIRNTEHGIRKE